MNFEIAEINFVVRGEKSTFRFAPLPAYRPFFGPERVYPTDISIRHQYGYFPKVRTLIKLFDGHRQAWEMFLDGAGYYLIRDVQTCEDTLWVARISRDFTSVIVHYGEEYLKLARDDAAVGFYQLRHPLDQILLMHILSRKAGAVIHAAAIAIDGKGYMMPGRSGSGKSTLSRQFLSRQVGQILNDDQIALRKTGDGFRVYGTPWTREPDFVTNACVPLAGIFFISHGATNHIRKISVKEALNRLLPTISIPWYDREIVPQMLQFCDDLISSVPMYELVCTPSPDVVDVITDFVST